MATPKITKLKFQIPKGWTRVKAHRGRRRVSTPTVSLTRTTLSFLGFGKELGTFTLLKRGSRCRVYFQPEYGDYKLIKRSYSNPKPIYEELGITVTKINRIELIPARCSGDAWEFMIDSVE